MMEKNKKGELLLQILIGIMACIWVGSMIIGYTLAYTKGETDVEKENERFSISVDSQLGTIKIVEKIQIENTGVYEYIGYDVETMCMYYVFCHFGKTDIRMAPYCVKGEDGNAHQAIFGVDYKE